MRQEKQGGGPETDQSYDKEYGLHGGLEVYQRQTRLNALKRKGYTALMTAGIVLLLISFFGIVAVFRWNGTLEAPLVPTSLPIKGDMRGTGPAPTCQTSCASAEISGTQQ
ncbi:hypothetical protein AWB81_07297 [Caballeronia arationis]|nr:hypothetical protein AWB81_07297 [Caballeronia arationis]